MLVTSLSMPCALPREHPRIVFLPARLTRAWTVGFTCSLRRSPRRRRRCRAHTI